MGTVPSHSAFLCVDHVGPRCSCCACESTSGFCIFDIHRETILKWLQGCNPMKLSLYFSLLSVSLSRSFSMFGKLGLRLVWKVVMAFLSFLPITNKDGEYQQASGVDLTNDNNLLVGSFSFIRSDLVVFTNTLHLTIGLGKARATRSVLCKVSEFC